MPYLSIIAGPNGAGKSTMSQSLLLERNITAFDFDKEFDSIWKQFDYDDAILEGAWNSTSNKFLQLKEEALLKKQNFAYETNFHTQDVIKTVEEFKRNGFTIELIFLALPNVEMAIERVKDRVLKKGHGVSIETITERFKSGLEILDRNFQSFDIFTLVISSNTRNRNLLHIEDQRGTKVATIKKSIPIELKQQLPLLTQYLRTIRAILHLRDLRP